VVTYLQTDGERVQLGTLEDGAELYYDRSLNTMVLDTANVSDTNAGLDLRNKAAGWVVQRAAVSAATDGSLAFNKQIITDTTAGNLTITVAMLRAGILARDPTGSARTDTFPTAANIVADIPNAVVGTSFWFILDNQGSAGEDITLAAGSGGTAQGTLVVGDTKSVCILFTLTNVTSGAEAYEVFVIGDHA